MELKDKVFDQLLAGHGIARASGTLVTVDQPLIEAVASPTLDYFISGTAKSELEPIIFFEPIGTISKDVWSTTIGNGTKAATRNSWN